MFGRYPEAAYDAADELADAANQAARKNDWDAVFTFAVRSTGGDGFAFEVYVADEEQRSDPMFESHETMTHQDAWGVIADLEGWFSGPLTLQDIADVIGHKR